MEIIIDGWRAGGEERRQAQSVPAGELPPLSEAQKEVAKKMGISQEDYARSAFAGRLNQERLLEKTRRFAENLDNKLRSKVNGARVDRIRLDTLEHEYHIELRANERRTFFRVSEDMVDDFIEGGSADVGRLIERNLETVLAGLAA
jgi:hypothetical protein